MNFFEPEFLKRKTKFIFTTKYYLIQYNQIINQTLL